MRDSSAFLMLEQPCNEAVAWVIQQANGVGLRVVRTFDLQTARYNPAGCPCPHHGAEQCDCQMVVLLVYGGEGQPVSLLAHCHDQTTWFSLVNTPQQPADPSLEGAIRQTLSAEGISPLT